MDSEYVINKAGGQAKMAALLGISRQAVCKWGDQVPLLRQYQLRQMRPHWFRGHPKPSKG